MTDLERFAAALLTQWRAEGGGDGGPIAVSALLTKVFPYRVARRTLGIDVSEDYEALVLRLLSEEEHLVRVEPVDAADMAKATITSKLPDLDVLQLLRAATMTITPRSIARLEGVLPMPNPRDESKWAEPEPPAPADRGAAARQDAIPSLQAEAPGQEPADDTKVIPFRAERDPGPAEPAPTGPLPAFLTTVSFSPPAEERCWSCSEPLPTDRDVKFCPFCGADQRQPACAACGAGVERKWKHCPDCGATLHG
jgi:RNA polymerase subunit RPABC4/transcription elongation factor Spt4